MLNVDLTIHDRNFKFSLTHDPAFVADANTKHMLHTYGACEPEVLHLMCRAIQPGDNVIDGGANIGFFTVIMSLLTGPTGTVFAFEPASNNLDKLNANVALNNLQNVTISPEALWSDKEEVTLHLCEDSGLNALAPKAESRGKVKVQGVRLATKRIPKPKLIKLDVEGAELPALEGCYSMLDRDKPYVVCEANPGAMQRIGYSLDSLRMFMWQFKYNMFILHRDGSLPTLVPERTTIRPMASNTNVLFATTDAVGRAWPEVAV